jgi:hypothetical protein
VWLQRKKDRELSNLTFTDGVALGIATGAFAAWCLHHVINMFSTAPPGSEAEAISDLDEYHDYQNAELTKAWDKLDDKPRRARP